jgi:uncharacterized glyoxalase superfamily protein PhnB
MSYGDVSPNPEFPATEETKKIVLQAQLNINGSQVMIMGKWECNSFENFIRRFHYGK